MITMVFFWLHNKTVANSPPPQLLSIRAVKFFKAVSSPVAGPRTAQEKFLKGIKNKDIR